MDRNVPVLFSFVKRAQPFENTGKIVFRSKFVLSATRARGADVPCTPAAQGGGESQARR